MESPETRHDTPTFRVFLNELMAQGNQTNANNSKMAVTPSQGRRSSEGATLSLLREQVRVSAEAAIVFHNRKHEMANTADGDSAGTPPFVLDSDGAPTKGEDVKTPTLNSEEAWLEMRRRFEIAHDPAARASSAGVGSPGPTQRHASQARRASVA